jgi:hypothetical protein
MQREPSLQSLSYMQYFAPFTRSLGTLTLTSPEFISMAVQAPFRQLTPGLQSVSNTQARAGIEVRQRTLTMTRLRIVVPCEEPPKITPRNVQIWTGIVFRITEITFFRERLKPQLLHREHYALIPPLYASKAHASEGMPTYAYTATSMDRLAQRVMKLQARIRSLHSGPNAMAISPTPCG